MLVALVVGWAGVVVGTLTNLAQAQRVRRIGVDGVNATTWCLFTLMSLFWLAYGSATGAVEVVVSAALGLPFLVVLLAMLGRSALRRGLVRSGVAVGAVVVVPTAVLGWNAGLLGLGALIVATRMPQLLQLVRATHADGVSTASWLLGSLNVTLWLVYYAATHRTFAEVSMGVALTANLSIVAMVVVRHRTSTVEPAVRELAVSA